MKGLYLVLLLAGNLFSQTTNAAISDSILADGIIWLTANLTDATDLTDVTDVADAIIAGMDFQDCKGADLMFNYVSSQIQEINLADFGDRQASYYLIQAPEVLEAYQWMRKNRGHKYSIHQMVVRVNRWYKGG